MGWWLAGIAALGVGMPATSGGAHESRSSFAQVLARLRIADIRETVLDRRRSNGFRDPIVVVRAVEAKVDVVERALETVSLGLAIAELCVEATEEDEP